MSFANNSRIIKHNGAPINGTSAVHTLTFANITAATFRLKVRGFLTGLITWSATNATLRSNVETALRALTNVGADGVDVAVGTMTNGLGTLTASFTGPLASSNIPVISVVQKNLTGADADITASITTAGVDATARGADVGALLLDTATGNYYQNAGTNRVPVWRPAFSGDALFPIKLALGSPAVGANTAIHAAVTDTGSQQVVTTGITQPDVPRNVTATAGGTAGDIKAIQVIVAGTDIDDNVITETLPAFTVDTGGTVTGSKAFKTITSVTIPAHDGTGATTAIGTGAKLGLPMKLNLNGVLRAFRNAAVEVTAPTVATSSSDVASNTVTLNSALNGTPIVLYALNDVTI